jgi:phosphatidylglycerol lysyltransferase
MKRPYLHYLGALLVVLVFCAALWLLYRQLEKYSLQQILDSLQEIPRSAVVLAIALTVLNYGILVCYDLLAVRYVGESLALWKVAMASFTGYACSYNFGATLAGTSIRYRLYSAWGMPILKILQLLVILGLTFWFGVFALAGVVFLLTPLRIPEDTMQKIVANFPQNQFLEDAFRFLFLNTRPLGSVLLAIALGYVALSAWHRGTIRLFRWQIPAPPLKLSLYQIGIASADMLVFGWVLYALCPPVQGGYPTVLAVYMVAYVAVVLSHVPGGWGVLEAVIITLMQELDYVPAENMPRVVAAIVVFRVIYFLAPLLIAAAMLGAHELHLGGVFRAFRRQARPPQPPAASPPVSQGPSSNGQRPGEQSPTPPSANRSSQGGKAPS